MALAVHLFMKANGSDVHGESTITSMERADSIECIAYHDHVTTQRQGGTGAATGRRVHDPIVFTKRLDKATPLLFKALCNAEDMEGEFRFYRPTPSGDGSTEHFQSVNFTGGRITDIKREIHNVLDPGSVNTPALETVHLMFSTIEVLYQPTGVGHQDEWSNDST